MVFNGVLGRMGNQEDFFDPGSHNLVDNVLNHRLIDDRQHFFRNRICGRQHMHKKSRYRYN